MKNIVLIPGLLNTAALYNLQKSYLNNRFNITVADHTKFETIAQIAEDILVNQAPDEFVIGGLSMGGYVAQEILRQAPHRVKGLLLMNTSARKDTPDQTKRRIAIMNATQSGRFKGVTKHLLPNLIHQDSLDNTLVTNVIIDMAQEIGRDAFIRQQKAIINRIDSRDTLTRVSVPACVVVGDSDKLTPPERAKEMATLLPSAELHIIERCGHLSPLECPEDVIEIIVNFMHKCV
ncbi:MAG: pimeloyl-ACP methyl ester carboxylesterase [Dasania sp.]|jgi:pimeloyl-ACP methyl ester carboxylesterase